MVRRRPSASPGLARDTRGVALIEFALALPLLILLFGVAVELARLWMVKRAFENSVVGVARMAASYPEYERRVRQYAEPIAASLMPGPSPSGINMSLDSLVRVKGVLTPQFATQSLLGTGSASPWSAHVSAADYVDNEAVIVVSATYAFTPMFHKIINKSFTFSTSYVILPFYSREYPYNSSDSADVYVR